jgi:hypothetical protein
MQMAGQPLRVFCGQAVAYLLTRLVLGQGVFEAALLFEQGSEVVARLGVSVG